MHYPVNVFVGKIRDYDGSRPSAIGKIRVDGELQLGDPGWKGTSRRKRKFTAGRIARCATIPASITSTGSANSRSRPICSAPRIRRKPFYRRANGKNVYIGDIFRWGEALIQVTQPRSPCFKLNYHFGISDMAQLMQNSGKVGWLYRIIAGGRVSSDAPLELVSRLSDVSVHEAGAIAPHMPFDDDQYHRLLSAAGLSVSWSRTMQKRRLSGRIEDNSRRLWK